MDRTHVTISAVGYHLPLKERSSFDLEKIISEKSPSVKVTKGIIEAMTGIYSRRIADEDLYSSDMAAVAAKNLFKDYSIDPRTIDLLIFASASQDLIEPATCNIVQEKIGTHCPIFDIKNACNSFINGLEVGEALIQSGRYSKVLVVVGETPSKCIKYSVTDRQDLKLSFSGYTFGDGGAAVLLEPTKEEGIFYTKFQTNSKYWEVGTLASGGTMHPRGDEFTYFKGDGSLIRDAFLELGPGLILDALDKTKTTYTDYKKIFVHQVSLSYLQTFVDLTKIPLELVEVTVDYIGNLAAASMPIGLGLAMQRGEIVKGDRIMFIGLAGGISLGVICCQL